MEYDQIHKVIRSDVHSSNPFYDRNVVFEMVVPDNMNKSHK